MSTTSVPGRLLGYALRAAGASEDSAAPAERAAAWANLQRLRHLLEDVSSTGEVVPADTLFRVLELIAPYAHGTRTLNEAVDADAIRVSAMLFGIGGVEALADRQCALLESYGAVFSARACARPHLAVEAKRWKTTTFLCDLCGMTVAVMAVQIVRLRHSKNASLRDRIVPVGRMLHETMSKLSDREKNIAAASKRTDNDAISVLGKVQAAYMRVLRPNTWYGQVGGDGRWVALAMPVMLAAGVWYEGGWSEFRRNDNGLLTSIGMLLLLCSLLPWLAPLLLKRDHGATERATRVSKMLVEMAMYLRQSSKATWGEYSFGDFDSEEKEKAGEETKNTEQDTAQGKTKGDALTKVQAKEANVSQASLEQNGDDVRAMLSSVRGLGDLVLQAMGGDKTMKSVADPDTSSDPEIRQGNSGELSVQVPFPPELLDKMIALEKMLRENGGDPAEIAKAAERVQLLKTLIGDTK